MHGFRIEGSSVFGEADFRPLLAPYLGREISSEDLAALRGALTRLYVDHGYVNSGAQIPDQDLAGGIVVVRIVEGTVTRIDVEGNVHYRTAVLRDRVARGVGRPLDVAKLEEALQILQQDPNIARIDARLSPGERPGEAVLNVRVAEARPYSLELAANNWSPPPFGGYRGEVTAGDQNLLGFGDALSGEFDVSDGLLAFDGHYSLPIDSRGTALRAEGEWSQSQIVDGDLAFLDIETDYSSVRLGVDVPLYRSVRTSLVASLLGDWRRADTCGHFGGSECDSFDSQGSGGRDGRSTVSVLRIVQELLRRDPRQVLAARSMLSVGLPILGARGGGLPPREPDGEFVAWLGQVQWARRFEPWGWQAFARTDVQLTSDRLPSLEDFPVGGHLSVRGYRENQLVRDEGVISSLELRIPVWPVEGSRDVVQLAPFADFAYSVNRRDENPGGPQLLGSVGVGIRLALFPGVSAQLYWGHQLVDAGTSGDLQDDGIQFGVTWRAF